MKSLLKLAIIFAAIQTCAFSSKAQGTVMANDAAILPLYPGSGPYLMLTNSVNPDQGRFGLFAIQITPQSDSTYLFSYAGIAEEYALNSSAYGEVIDPAFVMLTTPLVSNNGIDPGSSLQTFALFQSRYFGYWDVHSSESPSINDHYGWVLIQRTEFGLEVVTSATALGGGIIAGTLTQVPESSASLIISLGLGFWLVESRFRLTAQQV